MGGCHSALLSLTMVFDRVTQRNGGYTLCREVLTGLGFDVEDIELLTPRRHRWRWLLVVAAFVIFSMAVHPGALLDHWAKDAVTMIASS